MSGYEGFPPPGSDFPAPGAPPPRNPGAPQAAGVPPGYFPAPQMLQAAHKPGAIPLRPLGLGDLYDAAFKIIRFNPRATVGSSVIVSSVAMLIPVLVTGVLSLTVGMSLSAVGDDPSQIGAAEMVGLAGAYGSLLIGMLLQWIGMILVTGMNAHVASAAAVGRRLSLAEAWAATRGKRWRLIAMMALLFATTLVWLSVMVGGVVLLAATLSTAGAVVSSIVFLTVAVAALIFVWIRVAYLAVPPLMLESGGVFASLGRAFTLTRGQFWRTFGIALLTSIVASIVGGLLSVPVAGLGQVALVVDPGGSGLFWYVVCASLGQVVSAAVSSPFITTVSSLQYIDQRIRKEAYDVELMARVGIIAR